MELWGAPRGMKFHSFMEQLPVQAYIERDSHQAIKINANTYTRRKPFCLHYEEHFQNAGGTLYIREHITKGSPREAFLSTSTAPTSRTMVKRGSEQALHSPILREWGLAAIFISHSRTSTRGAKTRGIFYKSSWSPLVVWA